MAGRSFSFMPTNAAGVLYGAGLLFSPWLRGCTSCAASVAAVDMLAALLPVSSPGYAAPKPLRQGTEMCANVPLTTT